MKEKKYAGEVLTDSVSGEKEGTGGTSVQTSFLFPPPVRPCCFVLDIGSVPFGVYCVMGSVVGTAVVKFVGSMAASLARSLSDFREYPE